MCVYSVQSYVHVLLNQQQIPGLLNQMSAWKYSLVVGLTYKIVSGEPSSMYTCFSVSSTLVCDSVLQKKKKKMCV